MTSNGNGTIDAESNLLFGSNNLSLGTVGSPVDRIDVHAGQYWNINDEFKFLTSTVSPYGQSSIEIKLATLIEGKGMRAPFPVLWDGVNSGLGIENSSIRFKKDILDLTLDINDFFTKIRPVSYKYKTSDRPDIGFIAEEVALFDERLVAYMPQDEGEDLPHSVYYDRFVPLLVTITKSLREEIDMLKTEVEQLKNN